MFNYYLECVCVLIYALLLIINYSMWSHFQLSE
jgi:hypothetical protein